MNDQVDGDDTDAHLISDHELYRQIIAETVSTVPCAIKTRAKTPKTKPLGEVRGDVVSLIASRAADFVCSDDNKDLSQGARNVLTVKLINDICNAFPQAQPEHGYTNSHFDTAKLVIPAFINHGHYSQHLRAYAKLCGIAMDSIDLGTLSLPASYKSRDKHILDDQMHGQTTATSLADALEGNAMIIRPIKELEKRLNAMMDAVNANVQDLFQDDHKPQHHNSREAVWHKLELLKSLKDSILQEAAERETREPDAFGTAGHELKDYQWKLSPRGYAQIFLNGINLAANPKSDPLELEDAFKRGSKDRDELRDVIQQGETDKKKTSGWRPEIIHNRYNTTFIGMHEDDIAAGKEIAVTTVMSQHPDPEPSQADYAYKAAQNRAVEHIRLSLVESIKSIPCDPAGTTAAGTPPRTIGSMSRRSKPLRESIERFADSVLSMLNEPQFKDLHVSSANLLVSKVMVDLLQTAQGISRDDETALLKHKFIREFLDEVADNIRNPRDDYGRYIRACTTLCADIRDPLILDSTFMTPEGFAYADGVTRAPLPFDGSDVSAPAGRGLPNVAREGEDEEPNRPTARTSKKTPPPRPPSLYDMEMQAPIIMLPREELKRRLDTMMKHTKEHAFALFNIAAPAMGKGSDVSRKLEILEQFKADIFADAKKETEGTAELPSGPVHRSLLFDPFWNITVQGYCNMFMHGIELACSNIKPEKLAKDLAVGSKLWDKMHEVESETVAAIRAAPNYAPAATICKVRSLGTIHQPEMQRDKPVLLQ